jgi:hypothetical protein
VRTHRDGEFPFANDFNAMAQALEAGTQVESGCAVSDGGTDDLSLDVSAGSVVLDGTEASVGAQSVTLSGADADHDRYDLVVADGSGNASVVTGTASATPQAPSIPDGTVLLAIVEVPAGASGVTEANVNDARVVLDGIASTAIAALANLAAGEQFSGYPLSNADVKNSSFTVNARNQLTGGGTVSLGGSITLDALADPVYGDGSDGSVTDSGGSRSGVLCTTSYTLSGGTLDVTGKTLCIFAQDSIRIDGTIDATGQGGSGGAGGNGGTTNSNNGNSGNVGGQGAVAAASGTGGSGGSGDGGDGGPGAGGGGGGKTSYNNVGGPGADAADYSTNASERDALRVYQSSLYDDIYASVIDAGSGGSGGGGGHLDLNNESGNGGDGGDGGSGGGVVLLVAPEVTINGTVRAAGTAGQDGGDGSCDDTQAGGGGGGGGGSGGAVVVVGTTVDASTATFDVGGGAGGSGGWGAGGGGDGGNGGTGADGVVIRITDK